MATARLRDPVLRGLGGIEFQDDFAEIEGATSGRLQAQQVGAENIQPGEFVAGIPHARFINAAFSYWRPREPNRFNGPERGAWYASLHVRTSIAEVAFHMTRELQRINNFNTVADYSEMFASFAGEFIDLRKVQPKPPCLDPDPNVGYPAGNVLADETRAQGHNGIIYPSARDSKGTCLVALWPHAVQSVAQGAIIRLTWAGNPEPSHARIAT